MIIIGIDPDVTKSGVAVLDLSARTVAVAAMSFPMLIDKVRQLHEQCKEQEKRLKVFVEAGYLNHSNYHMRRSDNVWLASAKGNSIGRNHETARKIIECLRYWDISVEEIKPLGKRWRGRDRKITQEELNGILRDSRYVCKQKRMNQDERDACLIAITRNIL